MKINILLIIGILLLGFSCNNSGKADNGKSYSTFEDKIEDAEFEPSETKNKQNEKDSVQEKDELKGDLNELLKIFDTGGNKIPGEIYNLLLSKRQKELLDYDSGSDFYSIMPYQKIDGYFLLLLKSGNFNCTAINCQAEFNFLLVNKTGSVVSSYAIGGTYETDPNIELLHDSFIKIKWTINDYEENDAGAMEETGNPETYLRYITIIDNKLHDLSSLTKKQMRIQRNLIFARYGYKFKSKDLSGYFSKFDWYNPVNNDVKGQLTVNDKELVAEITKLENKK